MFILNITNIFKRVHYYLSEIYILCTSPLYSEQKGSILFTNQDYRELLREL